MNRYSKILHHVNLKKKETPKSSTGKKRTFEEYEAEQKKTDVDKLKEQAKELTDNIEFLQQLVVNQHDEVYELREQIKNEKKPRKQLNEGLLNEPPNVKNSDPLTPLDQKFVTFSQLSDHYRLFTNRILEQMATIGGGGETKLKYLDDIVGIATNPSVYDGKFLKYDNTLEKFIFDTAGGGGGSQNLNTTLGLGNTSNLGMSVGVLTATRAVFTEDCGPGFPAIQITGIVTSAQSNHGLLEVGELSFTDTNIITSFADEVDGYTQLIIQNKSNGANASADIVVNNNRADGAEKYGSFGINGSNYDPVDAFSDPNGTYLYATGGTLTIGTIDNYDLKFAANNLVSIRLDANTAVPYFGFVNPTISLFNPIAVFTYNSPSYSQVQIQNISNGSAASIDYVASTDTATDVSEYIDMGINGSGFSTDGLWGPKDGYIYVQGPLSGAGGNLVIGTKDGGDVIFHTLSNATANERLRITDTGVGIGTTNPTAKLEVQSGDIRVGINTSNGVILTSPNGTKYRLIVDNSGNLSTILVP